MTDHAAAGAQVSPVLVPGRGCDGCTMCCKLLAIDVLRKPRGAWCPHCDQKSGCTIYDSRPEPCRGFFCGYLRLAQLDDRWKPSKAKFLINYEDASKRIVLHADPSRPDAWREETYLRTIRQWAAKAERDGGMVMVWAGPRLTIVTSSRDHDLGVVGEDQQIVAIERRTPHGVERTFEARDPT